MKEETQSASPWQSEEETPDILADVKEKLLTSQQIRKLNIKSESKTIILKTRLQEPAFTIDTLHPYGSKAFQNSATSSESDLNINNC